MLVWFIYLLIVIAVFRDYNEFLDDLEEDPELRQNINIFKDPRNFNVPVDADDIDDPNAPHVTLEEMLDDLQIEDDPMDADEGNPMDA